MQLGYRLVTPLFINHKAEVNVFFGAPGALLFPGVLRRAHSRNSGMDEDCSASPSLLSH